MRVKPLAALLLPAALLALFLTSPLANGQAQTPTLIPRAYLPALWQGEGGPALAGCPMFPADTIWNRRVDSLPVHARSSQYINSIGATTTLHPDFGSGTWNGGPIGIPFAVVDANVDDVSVTFTYDDESDPGGYPIPANVPIEGGANSSGDRHVLLVDRDECRLYELWSAYPQANGTWRAGSGAIFDLRSNELRPDGWTSADAAGLPVLAGLVRYDEVLAGAIRHAIRFTASQTQSAYVWPARHEASDITSLSVPPMGQRFRLKASFNTSGYPADVRVILQAFKEYGLILADNGSNWYISGTPDPRWVDDVLVEAFETVRGSDFEAIDVSGLMIDPNSGQAKP